MAVDITDTSVVQTIISEIEGPQNLERKKTEWKSYEIASGKLRNYVREELMRILPKSWETMSISDVSLMKKVRDKLGRSYKTAPLMSKHVLAA